MNKFNYKNLCPFKWFVLQNFPFIEADFDAITNWQLFCKLGEEMNKIIEKVNQAGEQTENLTNAFIELQNYVNDYFENLDIQTEINNKLDEMAEGGQLAEIIAQYIQLNGVLAYNSVNELKNATNVANGSIARTLGFYSYYDGGGAYYKIRNITNTDVINDIDIIAIGTSNTLIAELIKPDNINVKIYGAKADGIHDDTDNIKLCIERNPNKTINFTDGIYLISDKISISNELDKIVDINCAENAKFISTVPIECFFEYGNTTRPNNFRAFRRNIINGGIFDCSNAQYGIIVDSRTYTPYIKNCSFIHVTNVGLYLRKDNSYVNGDCLVENISATGNDSIGSSDTIGVWIESFDNELNNIRVQATTIGLKITGGGNKIYNAHPLYIGTRAPTKAEYERTIGFLIDVVGFNWNEFIACYSDSFNTGYKITNFSRTSIINGYANTYVTPIQDLNSQFVWIQNQNAVVSLLNCRYDPTDPPTGVTYTAHNIRVDVPDYELPGMISKNNIQCLNCRWNNKEYTPDYDLSFGMKTNNIKSNIYSIPYAHTMQANRYYKVGLINISQALQKFEMNSASDGSWEIAINWNGGGTAGSATFLNVNKIKTPTHNLSLAICDSFIVGGVRYGYLAVKTTDTDCALNIGFENYSAGQSSELFTAFERYGLQPFTPTTIIAETSLN